ncbi:MAG: SDR family oxidoreductase [Verrucomicrobia bacterium]|nr:SDR family oxidoreductase [Verrucomicrobiota bacterium]
MAKVLVTGATGFVGKRLIAHLLEKGHEVYALCRIQGTQVFPEERKNLHYLWGDLRSPETLSVIPTEIEAAYYLVHSMTEIVSDLTQVEAEVAHHFVSALKQTKARHIIYLGGIINDEKSLSMHLKSRLLVEEILKDSGISTTILRASIIIGAGSASFEIIRDLTEKLPFMIAPKWVSTQCQPIAIRDVVFYLSEVLLRSDCLGKTFDIGGPDVFTFKQLLKDYAKFRNLKRVVLEVPVLTPRLSSYWLVLITSVRYSLCYYLVESMKVSSVCRLNEIRELIPHQCLTYSEALKIVFEKISQNEVLSTWMDAWDIDDVDASIQKFIQVPKEGCLSNEQRVLIKGDREAARERIWRIGGDTGWYALDWAWKVRGMIDKLVGGVGLNRGRRHPSEIEVGDAIDFWRVLRADKESADLILYASMKLPGEAWLEFRIEEKDGKEFLVQTATFRPRGISGRFYWYSMLPFHYFIFGKMARAIAGSK